MASKPRNGYDLSSPPVLPRGTRPFLRSRPTGDITLDWHEFASVEDAVRWMRQPHAKDFYLVAAPVGARCERCGFRKPVKSRAAVIAAGGNDGR